MKTLYISDLDGTLLDRRAKLTENTVRIISGLIKQGMLFTIATARSLSSIEILRELDINLPCVQLNGVLMYDFGTKSYIGCTAIKPDDARKVVEVLRRHGRMSFVYRSDKEYGIHVEFEKLQNQIEKDFFEARKDNDYKSFASVKEIRIADDDNVIYFTMIDRRERLEKIYQDICMIPGVRASLYSDNYSDMYFLEIYSSLATKANGMMMLKKQLGADRVVAFGDNLNDLEMLSQADIGIAVGDAVEEVRKSADLIIGNSYEDGVANYLFGIMNTEK